MFLSLKNGSMVLAAVCAFTFTASAHAAAVKTLSQRKSAELRATQLSDPNDVRTVAGAAHKATTTEDCKWANASSRNDVAVMAKANTGTRRSGGPVNGEKAIQ